jgi:hypothetical protein
MMHVPCYFSIVTSHGNHYLLSHNGLCWPNGTNTFSACSHFALDDFEDPLGAMVYLEIYRLPNMHDQHGLSASSLSENIEAMIDMGGLLGSKYTHHC